MFLRNMPAPIGDGTGVMRDVALVPSSLLRTGLQLPEQRVTLRIWTISSSSTNCASLIRVKAAVSMRFDSERRSATAASRHSSYTLCPSDQRQG